MASHTGYLRYFDLKPYDEGFVLELPERNRPDEIPPFAPEEKIFQVQKESQEWVEKLDISCVGDLNDRITGEGIQNILLVQEALQEAKISGIAERIAEAGNKKFVMIAGPSSSGKTTFSHRLSIQLRAHGMRPHPIAVDNYFVNRENTPLDEFGEKNYECLEAIDVEQFNKDMLALLSLSLIHIYRTSGNPSTLEGQVVRFSDKIAYLHHDMDDAQRAGIITEDDIPVTMRMLLGYTTRERLNTFVHDIIENSMDRDRIQMSEEIQEALMDLRELMFRSVYDHREAKREEKKAINMLKELYRYYIEHPEAMSREYRDLLLKGESTDRAVCDYLSGMTDQYSMTKFREIYIPQSWDSY